MEVYSAGGSSCWYCEPGQEPVTGERTEPTAIALLKECGITVPSKVLTWCQMQLSHPPPSGEPSYSAHSDEYRLMTDQSAENK